MTRTENETPANCAQGPEEPIVTIAQKSSTNPLTVAPPSSVPASVVTRLPCAPTAPVDRLAVASAICGLTAIVPVLSQIAGLALGIAALRRIRRARRDGVVLAGSGWAWTGLVSSGFVLLSWLFVFAALGGVMALFWHLAGKLDGIGATGH